MANATKESSASMRDEIEVVQTFDLPNGNFTLKVENFCFLVDSALLSEKSEFFRAACNGQFKEASERQITLEEVRPTDVARMVKWMYHEGFTDKTEGTIAPLWKSSDNIVAAKNVEEIMGDDTCSIHCREFASTYELADRFMIPRLRCSLSMSIISILRAESPLYLNVSSKARLYSRMTEDCAKLIDSAADEFPEVRDELLAWVWSCRKNGIPLKDGVVWYLEFSMKWHVDAIEQEFRRIGEKVRQETLSLAVR